MRIPRPHLLPFVPLYRAGLAMAGLRRESEHWLSHPVISVGSVSAGGAGKTPMVLLLIELLRKRGWSPVVLSRGYGRKSRGVERVNIAGDAQQFGDEPLLMARRSGAPVYVGANRCEAGMLAEERADAKTIYLLDDGFQHRRLGRDTDLALLTQRDTNDILLPAGDLREPVKAVRRADILVLRADEPRLAEQVQEISGSANPVVWKIRRSISIRGEQPKHPLVFCGIARPRNFFSMLRTGGYKPAARRTYADHHVYSDSDLHRLIRQAQRIDADGFLTTEKDAVKLSPVMREKLAFFFPVTVAQLDVELEDEDAAMDQLLELVQKRYGQRQRP